MNAGVNPLPKRRGMKMRFYFYLVLVMTILPLHSLSAADDPAANMCMSVLKVDIKDTNNVFGEQYAYNRLQDLLKTENFSDYHQFESAAQDLGLDIPLAKGMLGLTADAENNSQVFQSEMSTFLRSHYSEKINQSEFRSASSQINSQLLTVAMNCHNRYFDTLKDRIRLQVTVEPESLTKSIIKLDATTPQHMIERLRIKQIEPYGDIACMESGKPVALNVDRQDNQAVLNCDRKDSVFEQIHGRIHKSADESDLKIISKLCG